MKTLFLVPNNSEGQNIVRDVLYGAWCSGRLIGGATVPPLSILSVATVVRDAGLDMVFLDALGEKLSPAETRARAAGCDVVVVLTSFMTFAEDVKVLTDLKSANPDLRVILFGAQPTFLPEVCLTDSVITALVMREPEYAVRDLLQAWQDNAEWKTIPGIAYSENGETKTTIGYDFIRNLDEIPSPDRSFIPKGPDYYNPLIDSYPYTTALTSRGCPSHCTYCTAPFFMGGKLRARSAESVLEEIEYVVGLGYKTIYYRDETFCAFKKRNIKVCEGILAKDIKVKWVANAIAGELDEEYLTLMKRAGLYLIKFGIETGNESILQKVNKRMSLEQARHDLLLCNRLKVRTHAHCMLGMPGETRETIENTFRFIHQTNPSTVTYSVCSPYPGTPLFDEVKSKFPEIGELTPENLQIKNLHISSVYNEAFTSLTNEEIEAAVQEGYRRFYTRPSYILKSLLRIRSFAELSALVRSGLKILRFSVAGEK